MSERPILFSAPMVNAILAGTKTQTRQIIKPRPPAYLHNREFRPVNGTDLWGAWARSGNSLTVRSEDTIRCPYGVPGDRLIVRETWAVTGCNLVTYRADGATRQVERDLEPLWMQPNGSKWRPSTHLPHDLSRITLEITGVRVERLQDISEADALAEGVALLTDPVCARDEYRILWESINGPGSWDANPFVWCVEFKRLGGIR